MKRFFEIALMLSVLLSLNICLAETTEYPLYDSQGNLWVAREVKKLEKSIVPPEGTVDFSIKKGIIYFLLENGSFRKTHLTTGIKIPFFREKWYFTSLEKEGGTATIHGPFDESEKMGPILNWGVESSKIYALNNDSKIFLLDIGSGQIEQTLFFEEGVAEITVEGERIYLSSKNQISCYSLSGERQWTWKCRTAGGFGKIIVRDKIYTISDTQLFKIKVGRIDKKKEVRQSSVIASSVSTSKIIGLSIGEQIVITLDEEGNIKVYNTDLELLSRYSFRVEGARAIVVKNNRLYVLKNHRIQIFEFCEKN